MAGFTGKYSATAGDTFIFKGGVIWPVRSLWRPIAGSPTAQNVYSVDLNWFKGSEFKRPSFDGGGVTPLMLSMEAYNGNVTGYLQFDHLEFANCFKAQTANVANCMSFTNTEHVTFTKNRFATQTYATLGFTAQLSDKVLSGYTLKDNEFTNTASALTFGTYNSKNVVVKDIVINSNWYHDFQDQIGGGAHADGAWHGMTITEGDDANGHFVRFNDPTAYIQNLEFCNNKFTGRFDRWGTEGGGTAMFFQQGGLKDALLCNNVFTPDNTGTTSVSAFIFFASAGNPNSENLKIYNNSFIDNNVNGDFVYRAIFAADAWRGFDVKNNLFSKSNFCQLIDPAAWPNYTSDYNVYQCSSFGGGPAPSTYGNFSVWQSLGQDAHGKFSNDGTNAGTNLSSLGFKTLNLTSEGKARPTTGPWNAGAY
jgi:hypothetical protein